VQENHHCALTFAVLRSRSANLLDGLPPEEWRLARRLLVDAILATDMSQHFGLTQVGPPGLHSTRGLPCAHELLRRQGPRRCAPALTAPPAARAAAGAAEAPAQLCGRQRRRPRAAGEAPAPPGALPLPPPLPLPRSSAAHMHSLRAHRQT
jgi:hypothetical protein